jgi:hypothetical protein
MPNKNSSNSKKSSTSSNPAHSSQQNQQQLRYYQQLRLQQNQQLQQQLQQLTDQELLVSQNPLQPQQSLQPLDPSEPFHILRSGLQYPFPQQQQQANISKVTTTTGVTTTGVTSITATTMSTQEKLVRFANTTSSIKISSWLNLFEVLTDGKSDKERVLTLMSYLKSDALNFYAEDIVKDISTFTWAQCRTKFEDRFGDPIVEPIIAAQNRHLNRNDTVQSYYNEKMRFLRQTPLRDNDIVAMLTEGMPQSYKIQLIVARIKTLVEWLSVALQLETTMSKKFMSEPFKSNKSQTANFAMHSNTNKYKDKSLKRKPPHPCKYCTSLGKTLYHWHNECRNKPNNTENNKTTIESEPITEQQEPEDLN